MLTEAWSTKKQKAGKRKLFADISSVKLFDYLEWRETNTAATALIVDIYLMFSLIFVICLKSL